MIAGIGLDLIEFDHFQRFYSLADSETLDRCFTVTEQLDVGQETNALHRLAARMAAKEAVLKVLGGLQQGTAWTDIEILSSADGPHLRLTGGALARASALRISNWHLSLTHTTTVVAAVALAER